MRMCMVMSNPKGFPNIFSVTIQNWYCFTSNRQAASAFMQFNHIAKESGSLKNCGHTNEMKMWSAQLWLRFKQLQFKPEKKTKQFFSEEG